MLKKIFKYLVIAILCAIISLAFTNPSLKQFKEHIGETSWSPYTLIYKKQSNWLIFSTYSLSFELDDQNSDNDNDKKWILEARSGEYTGFFLNFYKK